MIEFLRKTAPCYIYDENEIIQRCQELKNTFECFQFLYSIKTNPFIPVIKTVFKEGFGSDSASNQEVLKCAAIGMKKENIMYSSPGKTEDDIRKTIGKCIIIADSLNEIKLIQKTAQDRNITEKIGIRLNPDFGMGSNSSSASKFGIDIEQKEELKELIKNCKNIKISGIHIHLKSQILNADIIGNYYKNIINLAIKLKDELNIDIEFINFGSGIGTVYDNSKEKPVDLDKLKQYADEIKSLNKKLKAALIIETGRFVICQAGKYITKVVDKKVSHGITYLIVLNGANGFLRPALANIVKCVSNGNNTKGYEPFYTNSNEFEVNVLNNNKEQETVCIAGNLCTGLDIIIDKAVLNKAEIGDLIEITNAGSYAYSLSPLLFASQEPPKQFLYTKNKEFIE